MCMLGIMTYVFLLFFFFKMQADFNSIVVVQADYFLQLVVKTDT